MGIRERYEAALAKNAAAQKELEAALNEMHKIGEYPPPPKSLRFPLDDQRKGLTRKMKIGVGEQGIEGFITSGVYSDGSLGEVFILAEKRGSFVSGLMNSFAAVFSIALQSGVPLERFITKFKHTRFEPAGVTNTPTIPLASSPLDYLVRWLEQHYVESAKEAPDVEFDTAAVN